MKRHLCNTTPRKSCMSISGSLIEDAAVMDVHVSAIMLRGRNQRGSGLGRRERRRREGRSSSGWRPLILGRLEGRDDPCRIRVFVSALKGLFLPLCLLHHGVELHQPVLNLVGRILDRHARHLHPVVDVKQSSEVLLAKLVRRALADSAFSSLRPGAVHGGPLLTVSLRVLFSGYHRLLRSIAAVDAGRREEVGRGPPHEVRLSLEVVARAVSLSSGKLFGSTLEDPRSRGGAAWTRGRGVL
mmetsp:Transcript_41/g.112  ORF Transcript_41/g.112 Transcript_41/m.112 type:complete len:242 (+) Transcript_41:2-727(+)